MPFALGHQLNICDTLMKWNDIEIFLNDVIFFNNETNFSYDEQWLEESRVIEKKQTV